MPTESSAQEPIMSRERIDVGAFTWDRIPRGTIRMRLRLRHCLSAVHVNCHRLRSFREESHVRIELTASSSLVWRK